jgi:hypothetical protein
MLERGAFNGVHAAMMIHPSPQESPTPDIIASSRLEAKYTGKSAHAAAAPHLGINAADAMTIAQTAIAFLRQQILPTDRIHGIITDGGDAIGQKQTRRFLHTYRFDTFVDVTPENAFENFVQIDPINPQSYRLLVKVDIGIDMREDIKHQRIGNSPLAC